MSPASRRRFARIAFLLYASAIITLTHWPRLALPETGLERTDLYVHLLVFAAWSTLFHLAAFFGPVLSIRAISLRQLAAAAYVCFDEGAQAIPFVHRDARWDDLAADLIGVTLATVVFLVAAKRANAKR